MTISPRLSAAIADRYRIEREIGAGGMATVYLAHDVKHDRQVAVKLLDPELGAVLGAERFLAEIRVTANLHHPNLLPLFDSGVADGFLYYVMPYVEGETLRARLEREKQLPIDEAVRIATAVANALGYAHAHGVIHRDLKPENILLQHGQPVVADFGIALAVQQAGGQRVTQTGLSLGTPQYMSPEQATGDRSIDGRTDVYALGAVTYEMLAGEPPHTGATAQAIIARLMTTEPQPLTVLRRSVTPGLAAAVHRALEKLPADRFETAQAFVDALSNPNYAGAPHDGAASRTGRGRVITPPFVGMTLAAVFGLAGWGWSAVQARRTATRAISAEFDLPLPDSLEATTFGTAASMSLSRDGSVLVFQAARRGETQALYVRRLGDRGVQRIRGTDGGRGPTLSPAGDEVLFTTIGNGANVIRRVAVRGGVPRSLTDSGGLGASWGDAGHIVFAGDGRLWIMPESGGPQTALATPDSARGHIRYAWPELLPGGRAALTVITKRGGESWLGIVTIPGGKVTELGLPGLNPRYSGTGHVLFAADDGGLLAAPFSTRSLKVTGPSMPIVESVRIGGGGAAAFAIADNGTLAYLAAADADASRELVAVSRSGTVRTLGVLPNDFAEPKVAPDGRRVAVTISENRVRARALGQYPDVWMLDLASSALTRLTTDSASSQPTWVDGGQRIAFRTRDDSVVRSLPVFTAGPATPYLRARHPIGMFAIGPRHGYSAIVPSVVSARARDIWIGPTDSLGVTRPLLDATYDEAWPAISPDGRWIAYETTRTGRTEVYVRPLVGDGPEVQVSITGGREPLWAPDGAAVFYRTSGGSGRVMLAQLALRPRLEVQRRDTLFEDSFRFGYDVFPDGKELLMVRGRAGGIARASTVTVNLNWRPGRSGQRAAEREP